MTEAAVAEGARTYSRDGLQVTEFAAQSGGANSEYILASSRCSVEPSRLRAVFNGELRQPLDNTPLPSGGRAQVQLLKLDDTPLVLRRYRRGGLPARFVQTRYLWRGLVQSRAYQELTLLSYLQQQGVPSCLPFAASVTHHGVFYRASLLTELVPGAEPMAERLVQGGMQANDWRAVGKLVRQMHSAGVFHADLNAHNILFSDHGAVLIDFDRGEIRPQSRTWQAANVSRLKRSLEKLSARHQQVFSGSDWQELLSAYND